MHITSLFFVSVIVTTSFLRWISAEPRQLCPWTKVMSNGEAHHNFLRTEQRDPQQPSPSVRLYHSVWSRERALVNCAWSDDAAVIENYLSLCKERTNEFSENQAEDFDIIPMFALCVPVSSLSSPTDTGREERTGKRQVRSVDDDIDGLAPYGQLDRSGIENHRRVKRGFIVPGTLWCGSGDKALSYADLGVFAETDSCCREHDQCKDTILSFQSSYGVFNRNIFTMSHCDCDNRFRSCLAGAEDSISDVVGYTFFNLLKMQCFEFSHKLQCAERNWFGMCKEMKVSLYAEVHPPTIYESTQPADEGNVTVNTTDINTTISTHGQLSTQAQESSTSVPESASIFGASASTTPALSAVSTFTSTVIYTPDASSSGMRMLERGTAAMPVRSQDLVNTSPTKGPRSTADTAKPTLSNGLTLTEQDTADTGKQLSCDVYRDLDECSFKIPPQQRRYGLHNPEPRTLYHCNCTSRLFQGLGQQRGLTGPHAVLLGYVSQSCFLPQDCTVGKICTAALVKPALPQLVQMSGGDTEEGRHLQAMRLKVRRPIARRAKRKDRSVRLHKRCLRMTQPKLHRTRRVRIHGAHTGLP